jgi:hypothetical protein
MPDELIDLTKIKPSETFGRFDKTDLIILLTTGGVGYLAREGLIYQIFFPWCAHGDGAVAGSSGTHRSLWASWGIIA